MIALLATASLTLLLLPARPRPQAELALLEAALVDDPLNAKFVLLSDSSVPLYPPQLAWAQLMAEPASRIDACPDRLGELNIYRWAHAGSDYYSLASCHKAGRRRQQAGWLGRSITYNF